ncbi:class I SAM-dependent methyltransferase [Brevibacterium renqingii]|uniref:class I SAM-dependent methyltransferase n=1 Tax=Brevibacterium renqingii TaxID=2776916 RepID=UPI001AE02966|nr:class I SAM-dependent methyltransferase [Brevibacterium renqingii]
MEYFEDRKRAESFGEAAAAYDAYRPRYPSALITAIMQAADSGAEVPRILDVGSGTGILASQLKDAGGEVLAVEPDVEMAAVARTKGLEVEVSTFEDWDGQDRTFDLISFGQSFHWVDPLIALPRIRALLKPGGRLALAWNDIEPKGEVRTRLEAIAARFHPEGTRPSLGTAGAAETFETVEHPALAQLRATGFTACESSFTEDLHSSKHDWLSMVFTYSAQLTMDPVKRAVMREEMAAEIPADGLDAANAALLILARI